MIFTGKMRFQSKVKAYASMPGPRNQISNARSSTTFLAKGFDIALPESVDQPRSEADASRPRVGDDDHIGI